MPFGCHRLAKREVEFAPRKHGLPPVRSSLFSGGRTPTTTPTEMNLEYASATLHAPAEAVRAEVGQPPSARLPLVVYVLAQGTFLMGTTEFVVAGLLPEIAGDLQVSVAQTGLLITFFAIGMIVGAPLMAMLTLRLPTRLPLMLALAVFALGPVIVAVGSSFTLLLAARFLTAIATGAFRAVANVAATRAAGPAASARVLGLVGAGAMLVNVVGVPLGAFAGQHMGWRGPLWTRRLRSRGRPADRPHRPAGRPGPAAGIDPLRADRAALRPPVARADHLRHHDRRCAGRVLPHRTAADRPGRARRRAHAAGRVGFGLGALVGSIVGGRLGDCRPHTVTVTFTAAAGAALLLLGIVLSADSAPATIVLVALLGFFGLGAHPVPMALAVRYAGQASTLASALTVSAFNLGTAIGPWIAGLTLESTGATGPTMVGTVIAALTLVPTTALALRDHRPAAVGAGAH